MSMTLDEIDRDVGYFLAQRTWAKRCPYAAEWTSRLHNYRATAMGTAYEDALDAVLMTLPRGSTDADIICLMVRLYKSDETRFWSEKFPKQTRRPVVRALAALAHRFPKSHICSIYLKRLRRIMRGEPVEGFRLGYNC